MSFNTDTASAGFLPQETQQVVSAFEKLGTDEKLALLYYVYKKMGDSITPAAPSVTNPELAPYLMGDVFDMSNDQQLAIMREIVNGDDTESSHAYGALTENNQLMVWYAWAQGMGDTIVDMPRDYKAGESINQALNQIENLEFQEQISMLRTVVGRMGYSNIQKIPTQEETGKTQSL